MLPVLILLSPHFLSAQKRVQHTNSIWLGYYNTVRFSDKLALATDMQLRTTNWTQKWLQQLIRTGVAYRINKKFTTTGGFAWFRHAQYNNNKLLYRNEWRPWQELALQLSKNDWLVNQRMRTEQRFLQAISNGTLGKHYNFLFRLRYKADVQWAVNEKWSVLAGNELLVNPFERGYRFFDQNRTSAGILWKAFPTVNLQVQYAKIIQKKTVTDIENSDVVRLNIYHNIQWSK